MPTAIKFLFEDLENDPKDDLLYIISEVIKDEKLPVDEIQIIDCDPSEPVPTFEGDYYSENEGRQSLITMGKPSPYMVATNANLTVGPSQGVIFNSSAGLERLRRAIRLWWKKLNDEIEDSSYIYDLFEAEDHEGIEHFCSKTAGYKYLYVDIEVSGDIKVDEPEDTELLSVAVLKTRTGEDYEIFVWTRDALADPYCRAQLIKLLTSGITLVAHNGQFDFKWINNHFEVELRKLGIRELYPDGDEDTLNLHYAQFPGATGDHGLKDLCQKLMGAPEWEKEIKKYAPSKGHYERIPIYLLCSYNAGDVFWTWKLHKLLKAWLAEGSKGPRYLLKTIIKPATSMFIDVESTKAGWPFDVPFAETLAMKLTVEAKQQLAKLQEYIPDPTTVISAAHAKQRDAWLAKGTPLRDYHSFNPGSAEQVGKYLASTGAALPRNKPTARKPEGSIKTDEKTLTKLSKDLRTPGSIRAFIKELLEYRHTTKMLGTYVLGILKRVRNGRVRPKYKVAGTITGRLASTAPAIQTIPKENAGPLREMFTVEKGEILVGVDYSNLETRCVAELCGDPQMIEDLQLGKPDFFSLLLPGAFPKVFKNLDAVWKMKAEDPARFKIYRNRIKPFSHGVNYGRRYRAIALDLELPLDEAQYIMQSYLDRYPQLVAWQEETMSFVRGEIIDPTWGVPGLWTQFGRRFQQGVIWEGNEINIKNSALAFRPQSVGSDICLSAAIQLHNCDLPQRKARLVGFVHDALYAITKRENGQDVLDIMTQRMEEAAAKVFQRVPFPCDGHLGMNWAEVG